MRSRNVILAAHVIRFGIPFGLMLVASNMIYALLFRDEGIDSEVVGKSVVTFGIIIIGSLVLGLIRSSRENV